MKKFVWIVMTLLWSVVGLASAFAAMLTPMMFDAPGSEANHHLQALALCVVLLPVLCLLGIILPWVLQSKKFAGWLFLLPVIDIVPIVILAELFNTDGS